MNLNQNLIPNNAPPHVMGRVMAIHSLLMTGLAPLGALVVGIIACGIDSAPLTFSVGDALMLAPALYFISAKRHPRAMAWHGVA